MTGYNIKKLFTHSASLYGGPALILKIFGEENKVELLARELTSETALYLEKTVCECDSPPLRLPLLPTVIMLKITIPEIEQ
jgi:hypothetical protein